MMSRSSHWIFGAAILAATLSGCAVDTGSSTASANQALVAAPGSDDPAAPVEGGDDPTGGGGTPIATSGPAIACVESGDSEPMPPEVQAQVQAASLSSAAAAAPAVDQPPAPTCSTDQSTASVAPSTEGSFASLAPDGCYPDPGTIWYCGGALCVALGGNRGLQCELIFGLCQRVRILPNCA